jgi:hypothetical protein
MTAEKNMYSKETSAMHFLNQTLALLLSFACVALWSRMLSGQILALQFPTLNVLFYFGFVFISIELMKHIKRPGTSANKHGGGHASIKYDYKTF